ncbi:MAG: 1,4-alpha-glucan branching protein GlgB [Gammaproteobacteria bacterium]|nr:1,4-alpha-glucan branching protein GlgB [Gammaproteobacteria bacterium]
MATLKHNIDTIALGVNRDPFKVLGPRSARKNWVVRCWQPQAQAVELVTVDEKPLAKMNRIHADGLFEARLPLPTTDYRLRLIEQGNSRVIDDPYRFPSPLGDLDRHLMREGAHLKLDDKLGANLIELDEVKGVHFAVWAPNASRVSVVGSFNDWDGRRHPMRLHLNNGVWDLFIPGMGSGELYKFELLDAEGGLLPLKADPFARRMESPPGNASIVHYDDYQWQDDSWISNRSEKNTLDGPMATYEVHLGSWRRGNNNSFLSYRDLASDLVAYVREMGYTHIELLPVTEHPFDGSWGYQPIGLFAPTYRFGNPEDFKYFVDACHQQEIGVIMDWVPAHFPRDEFGLGLFDGSHLYEHADPRQGAHQDWGTLIFNFGSAEVVNYLLASALFWIEEFHIDALRVDAVSSMLYLDYSREPGEWLPNQYGGNENLEAVAFLRRMNEQVHARGGVTIAEESTAWPQVSHPIYNGGLGFSYKWNMGWMNDSLAFFKEDPVHRSYHHDKLTFGLLYAFNENFILPLSHDEVVHGKSSLIGRMPGNSWLAFANLRLYYTFMYGHPGKKLLFMGGEFAQQREWNHSTSLDWHLLDLPLHAGIRQLVKDLNRLYQTSPALYEIDFDAGGFEWIDCSDNQQCVISFLRRGKNPAELVVVVCNMTPIVRHNYRIGVPAAGRYRERFNSDASAYGGSGVGNLGAVNSEQIGAHGREHSLNLNLPPLAALILQLD